MDLRTQLQTAIGSAYTLDRELGGGGMSRVFVAEETALRRKVVVKVLPPELAAGVNFERFRREIQFAASLQQAHILPVLSAGDMDGVPYYTMPFVEGESLRARLATTGALPIPEAVGILRDVARALAYAHSRGVVHRDIKPDNVLLAGGSAVVADFGIAKALTESRTAGHAPTLTQIGTSLGTPAYMAPEQAAADPATDHRADLYSFGAMAYEMIAGRPPFIAPSPQRLLAMQMSEAPEPVAHLRPDVPPALAELIMACLAKDATERPQSAADVLRILETVTSPGTTPAMPAILLGGRGMLRKALATYAAAFVIVATLAKAAIVGIGLPGWVFPGALVIMALGLPVILFTAYVHRLARRAATATPTYTPGGTPSLGGGTLATIAVKASPHVSWRRAAYGGVGAVGLFVLVVAAYMTLRALGIGPAGSLFAAGTLDENERLLVDDFTSPSADSSLGAVVTEAFRTALGESQSVTLMQPAEVREVLRRMQKPPGGRVDLTLAREIGTREGLKAIIDGSILSLGGRYQLAVRLVNTQTGQPMASFAQTASSEADILPAIDALTRELRAKIGESLRTVQAAKPLEQVTTSSLEALRLYVQAVHALEVDGNFEKGTSLLEEAEALDTGFAMAYRKQAMELSNRPGFASKVVALLQKAYDHRDRLSDPERYLTIAGYYALGPHADLAKSTQAYEALLDIQPNNGTALNDLGVNYLYTHDFARAEEVLKRAVALPSPAAQEFDNLMEVYYDEGKTALAVAMADTALGRFPRYPGIILDHALITMMRGHEDSARLSLEPLLRSADVSARTVAAVELETLDVLHGRLASGSRWRAEAAAGQRARGAPTVDLNMALDSAFMTVWFHDDAAGALREADAALAHHPIDSIPAIQRPYPMLAHIYALAGRPDRAKTFAAAWERTRRNYTRFNDAVPRHAMQGDIALAEHRYDDAVREYRQAVGPCILCMVPNIAHAYDLAGNADSAIAVFRRYVDTPAMERVGPRGTDALYLAGAYKRLGELYEAKGDRARAAEYYGRFVSLWQRADPEFQPKVVEVRKRLARLRTEGAS